MFYHINTTSPTNTQDIIPEYQDSHEIASQPAFQQGYPSSREQSNPQGHIPTYYHNFHESSRPPASPQGHSTNIGLTTGLGSFWASSNQVNEKLTKPPTSPPKFRPDYQARRQPTNPPGQIPTYQGSHQSARSPTSPPPRGHPTSYQSIHQPAGSPNSRSDHPRNDEVTHQPKSYTRSPISAPQDYPLAFEDIAKLAKSPTSISGFQLGYQASREPTNPPDHIPTYQDSTRSTTNKSGPTIYLSKHKSNRSPTSVPDHQRGNQTIHPPSRTPFGGPINSLASHKATHKPTRIPEDLTSRQPTYQATNQFGESPPRKPRWSLNAYRVTDQPTRSPSRSPTRSPDPEQVFLRSPNKSTSRSPFGSPLKHQDRDQYTRSHTKVQGYSPEHADTPQTTGSLTRLHTHPRAYKDTHTATLPPTGLPIHRPAHEAIYQPTKTVSSLIRDQHTGYSPHITRSSPISTQAHQSGYQRSWESTQRPGHIQTYQDTLKPTSLIRSAPAYQSTHQPRSPTRFTRSPTSLGRSPSCVSGHPSDIEGRSPGVPTRSPKGILRSPSRSSPSVYHHVSHQPRQRKKSVTILTPQ